MTTITISLLSLRRYAGCAVPQPKERLDAVVAEVRHAKPDLLVCAMDFLGSQADVMDLEKQLALFPHRTTVVINAVAPHLQPKIGTNKDEGKKWEPLMVIEPHQSSRIFARQIIAQAFERSAATYQALIQQLDSRKVQVKQRWVSCLCCGEINFLTLPRAGGQPFFDNRFPQVARHYAAADIILNPTHDLMIGRPFITKAKRRFLSRQIQGRSRCFVSVSNWDSEKPGQKCAVSELHPELHTVYVNRHPQQIAQTALNRYGEFMACSRVTVTL